MPHVDRQKVLDENAAWQMQLIEAFGICPFAKQCRESGRLWRHVLDVKAGDVADAVLQTILDMHRQPERDGMIPEIGLLLCPTAKMAAPAFERLVRTAGDLAAETVRAEGGQPQFYVVAFHPQMSYSDADPQKLVGFWRRSPHPTVQFVHIASLNALRGTHVPPKYVDPDDLLAVQALLGRTVTGDMADRIALVNWRTYHAQAKVILAKSAQLLASSRVG